MESLTRQQVIDIVGELSDVSIVEIISTGATAPELAEAFMRLTADDDKEGALAHPASGVVAQLIDILEADQPSAEEERA